MNRHWTGSIGEVARIGRVTVRTLHHYDAIGLLRPSKRAAGDARRYTREDLERLHQIRLYRDLDMPLAQIGELLEHSRLDRRKNLLSHRDRLAAESAAVQKRIQTLDRLLKGEPEMSVEDLFEGFQTVAEAREAKQRWGATESYRIAQQRVKQYGKADLEALRMAHAELVEQLAKAMLAGHAPGSAEATDCAEAMRLHMDRAYYPLSHAAHAQLGQMYLEDPRFQKVYEDAAPGLTRYLASAIQANAGRA